MNIKKSPACRKKGESKSECVSRKIPEILDENPGMAQDQAIAIAESVCSKKCSSKFLSCNEIVELGEKDYLTSKEIDERVVKAMRPDLLYRTHRALHVESKGSARSKKIVSAHTIVANELKSRGFLHHTWDKLDNVYQE